MENKPQIGEDANCLQTTSAGGNCNSLDQGAFTNSMSSSLDDQGKVSLVYSSQASHQGIQSSTPSPGLNPMSLPSMSPSLTNLACAATNVVSPSYHLDNVSGVSHNSVGHGPRHYTPCIVSSSQRQMQGRPLSLHTISQQQQQFTQKAPQFMYQLENHVMKQNGHGNMQPSTAQSHIHHQQTQLQSSLQSLIHKSSGSQTSPSALPQGQSTSFMQSSPQSSVQQFKPSALQQPPQAMIRQHQQSQQSLHQQKSPTTLQSALASQQNQRRMVKKTNETAIYQNQAFGQSNNVSNMRHQQEQQWISGAKQQQLLGPQHEASISNMPLQQQMQQATSTCFPTPGPQSQSNASQQQLVSQLQMQPAHLQQHLDQMNPIALQRDVHQWAHKSSAFFESENEMERQKQLLPSQKFSSKASSTSINNAALTALTNTIDGAEEVNERIKTMKAMYLPTLAEIWKFVCNCLQTGVHTVKPEQSEKLKSCKAQLEYCHQFLNKLESNTATSVNLDNVEHRIVKFINGFKYNRSAMLQQQGKQHLQQTQMLYHESQMNPPMQRRSFNSVVTATQPCNPSMHHDSTPPSIHSGIPAPQPEMMNALQPGSSLQLQQSAARHIPKITMNANQQAQMNMVSQNGSIELQPNINLLQQNSNMFFNQQLRQQEHQVMLAHHLKQQLQSNHMSNLVMQQQEQQAVLQRHQKNMQIQNQQQQRHQQQKLPPWNQPQLHQTNEVRDYKTIQGISAKSGKVPYNSPGLQSAHEHVLKTSPYHVSSPRPPAQAASPQVSQHSSPQTDQQNLVSCLSRAGTPLQSTNSSIIAVLSPSTSLAQYSPAQGDPEKPSSAVSSHSNAGSTVDQQAVSLAKPHSAVISTPGISASPLLAESTPTDNYQFSAPAIVSGESCKTDQPHERLLKVIKSIAPKAFGSSIGDADSVLCNTVDTMDDRSSMQDNGCSMFFGESLVGVTKHSSLSKRVVADDEIVARKKMKCRSFAVMRSNVVSSDDCIEDRQKHLDGHEIQDLGSSAESKVNRVMLEEIKEINRKLLTTVVEISDNDDKVISTCAATQDGVGTIVRCSFRAMALCPDSKLHHTSSQMMPVLPVQLLVSTNYPNCSPVFLDNCPVNLSKEYDVMFMKAKSWFTRSLRCLTQPMSLEEMAKSWDACASAAMKEHAQRNGGGSFSSRYGTWQNCVNTM
ncbi:hypothetical protein Scep_011580 [Stephania cephalantha]|uniref:Uncharacterized protein n=1 Tax=Stephania cephalantha TaxID=152367 RepID=A0AAP0P5P6_9MAGN